MKRNIYVCEEHHHVLNEWINHKGCNVITLDYHTDTHPAFLNHCYHDKSNSAESILQSFSNGKMSLSDCINMLNNDEHIDFAIRANLINKVFVLPSGGSGGNGYINKNIFDGRHQNVFQGQGIIECAYSCLPDCNKNGHDDDCLIEFSDNVLTDRLLVPAMEKVVHYIPDFFDSYILDIDLDYFRTCESLNKNNISRFKWLVKNAEAITIAKESACVEMCRLENEPITSGWALSRICQIIESVD